MEVQVQEGYYVSKKYASLERFINYFYQIDAVRRHKPANVLFIGVGDGVVPYFLRASGMSVTTLDFDPVLKPDIVGDVRKLPLIDNAFDLVCIFEVLEHLPWEQSKEALGELARVSKKGVVISVPHRRSGFDLVFKFPGIRSLLKRDLVRLPILFPVRFPGFAVSKQHYWEIDGRSTTLAQYRSALREHFFITREFTPVLDSYRRFFELQVKGR